MAECCKTIEIIGEGITEEAYVKSIRDIVRHKPNKRFRKASSLKELERNIKECIKNGVSLVLCLIDMDNKTADGVHEHEINAQKYEKLKNTYHNKEFTNVLHENTRVVFIESYPSIETFFFYYGGYTTAAKTNEGLKKDLKRKYGYEVSSKYFNSHSLHEGVFSCEGSCLANAISNAKKSVKNRCKEDKHASYSEMYVLFDTLELLD